MPIVKLHMKNIKESLFLNFKVLNGSLINWHITKIYLKVA